MPRTRTSSDLELLVELDRRSGEPLHRQLERGLRGAIRDGPARGRQRRCRRAERWRRSSGSRAASSSRRTSSSSPRATSSAGPAARTRVARPAVAAPPAAARRRGPPTSPSTSGRAGRSVREFPRAAWLRRCGACSATAPSERLDVPRRARRAGAANGPRRVPQPRPRNGRRPGRRRRSAPASPRASGSSSERSARRGARTVAVEDPSDPEYRATIAAAGLDWVAIPVDDDGLRVDLLGGDRRPTPSS